MELKLPIIFSICILIMSNSVAFGMTASEIMEKYPDPKALQADIDKGIINYDDLPFGIKAQVNDTYPYSIEQTKQTQPTDYLVSIIAFMVAGLLFIPLKLMVVRMGQYGMLCFIALSIGLGAIWIPGVFDLDGHIGATVIDCSVFGGIGLAFMMRARLSLTIHEEEELKEIRDRPRTLPKGHITNQPAKPELKPSTIHKILISIGILRIKKDA